MVLAPAVGALSFVLSPDSIATPHRELLDRTVQASLKLASGQAVVQIVSASITSLVEGVLASMFINNLRWVGVTALVCGLALTGVGVMARQDPKTKNRESSNVGDRRPVAATTPAAGSEKPTAPAAEAPDDTKRLKELSKEMLKAAMMEWEQAYKEFLHTNNGLERAYQASKRLMDAHIVAFNGPEEKVAQAQAHFERIREIARANVASSTGIESTRLSAYAAEASLWLAQAKVNATEKPRDAGSGEEAKDGRGNDPKSRLILAKLDEPISMPFNDDTSLEDVLKYIKQATTTDRYNGIPIYVDPLGLQEAEKSMTSTVRGMQLEGVPLRRTLHLLLKQLDLIYFVEDGILYITSKESEDRWGVLGPAIAEPSPILQKAEKAERGEMSLSEMKNLIELFKTREQIMKLSSGQSEEKHEEAASNKQHEEAKQDREQMNLLLKEMRELIALLKSERQTKKAAEVK